MIRRSLPDRFRTRLARLSGLAVVGMFLFSAMAAMAADPPVLPAPKVLRDPDAPILDIPIPNVSFTKGLNDSGVLSLPYIGQYVGGLYTFLISIVGLVAAAMLMVGGFQYLTSGGDKTKISEGKKRIFNALVGMVLAFGSWILLYTINPALTSFEGLKLSNVETELADADSGADISDEEVAAASTSSEGGATASVSGKVPLYKQFDRKFSEDLGCSPTNMQDSGCGPTSAAMVMASYGSTAKPQEIERLLRQQHFKTCGGGTNSAGLIAASTVGTLGFTGRSIDDPEKIKQLLREGKPIVLGVRGPSIFTTKGHYIVLTGIDAQGNLIINDPNKDKYLQVLIAKRKVGSNTPFPPCPGGTEIHKKKWEICLGKKFPSPILSSKVPEEYVWSVMSHAHYIYPK